MKLSELKSYLLNISELNFELYNSTPIPSHFHITEAGLLTKHFIDCGKSIHTRKTAVFQIWTADDIWHRLEPQTLLNIIEKSEKVFRNEDPEIEIEYQMETIGKFGLDFKDGRFILTPKQTECLAKEKCGVTYENIEAPQFTDSKQAESCCEPARNCC